MALIHYDWCLYKTRTFGHRWLQKKDHVETQREDNGHVQAKERCARRNQPRHSHLRLPASRSDQIRSVAQSCPTLCDPMNRSTPGLPVHHQLPKFTETHVHRVSDAIQPSHPLSSPSPPAPNPSQHQSLFQ